MVVLPILVMYTDMKRGLFTYLVINSFNLVQQSFRAYCFDIILFEVDPLMVQGLQVIFLILFSPDTVKVTLSFSPLLFFSF